MSSRRANGWFRQGRTTPCFSRSFCWWVGSCQSPIRLSAGNDRGLHSSPSDVRRDRAHASSNRAVTVAAVSPVLRLRLTSSQSQASHGRLFQLSPAGVGRVETTRTEFDGTFASYGTVRAQHGSRRCRDHRNCQAYPQNARSRRKHHCLDRHSPQPSRRATISKSGRGESPGVAGWRGNP